MKPVISVAVICLLAGGATIAAAQGPKEPDGPAPRTMPEGAEPKGPKDAIPDKIAPKEPRPEAKRDRGKSTEAPGREKESDRATEAPRRSKDAERSTESPRTGKDSDRVVRDKDKDDADRRAPTRKSATPEDDGKAPRTGKTPDPKDRPSTATPRDDKSAPRTGEGTRKDEPPKAAAPENDRARERESASPRDGARKDVQLSEEQRTTVRKSMERERSSRTANVRFDVTVGARVPREVTLHPVPPEVVEIVPEYRSYRYVWVEDEIVIVDPQTYAVVEVVDREPTRRAGRGGSARLTLSGRERDLVLQHVEMPRDTIALNVEVGRRVPDAVRLYEFPEAVIDEVPKLRDYRYVVDEDDVVIVDPRQEIAILKIEQ